MHYTAKHNAVTKITNYCQRRRMVLCSSVCVCVHPVCTPRDRKSSEPSHHMTVKVTSHVFKFNYYM